MYARFLDVFNNKKYDELELKRHEVSRSFDTSNAGR